MSEQTVAKKVRRVFKVEKTGQEIVNEIGELTNKVAELVTALGELPSEGAAYAIVKEAHDQAQAALDKALDTVHHS